MEGVRDLGGRRDARPWGVPTRLADSGLGPPLSPKNPRPPLEGIPHAESEIRWIGFRRFPSRLEGEDSSMGGRRPEGTMFVFAVVHRLGFTSPLHRTILLMVLGEARVRERP